MALDPGDYGALAGVLVILLVVLVYNQMKARPGNTASASMPEGHDEDASVHPFLSRFVVHDGDVVGETVAVEGDRLVLKQAGVFKAVDVGQADLRGDEVHISGFVDWEHAKQDGQAWLERNRKGADDAVSPELTRSEDVRSPALEAFKRREAEQTTDDSEE